VRAALTRIEPIESSPGLDNEGGVVHSRHRLSARAGTEIMYLHKLLRISFLPFYRYFNIYLYNFQVKIKIKKKKTVGKGKKEASEVRGKNQFSKKMKKYEKTIAFLIFLC
jgi:hypothetical protein